MDPLISPWLFYVAEVCEVLKIMCLVFAILGSLFTLIPLLIGFLDGGKWPPWAKPAVMVLLIFGAVGVLAPSQSTLYKMVVTSQITPNTVSKTISLGDNLRETLKGDIIDIINSVVDKESR